MKIGYVRTSTLEQVAGGEGINNLTPADVYFGGLQAELPEQK